MAKAINDATLNKAGDIYQYLIALRDCFELNDDDILQIETNGDISIINSKGGLFQKEVKHHFEDHFLSERDIDFWKTLANWYEDYGRVKFFSNYILSTTAKIANSSSFYEWNCIKKEEKLKRLKSIGEVIKERETIFRKQYNRIFGEGYDEGKILNILEKFTIEAERTSLAGISNEFVKYVGHIPKENRDSYIGALLGIIMFRVKEPPHKWEVSRREFEEILQKVTPAYMEKGKIPLPMEYARAVMPDEEVPFLKQKKFVREIQEIEYDTMILSAMLDYWKTGLTVAKYFQDDFMYLDSLEDYKQELTETMKYEKETKELEIEEESKEKRIRYSKKLYTSMMNWEVKDFGSIIQNQGFFQRGVIHNIVDETDFRWKIGEEKDEHK